jgi:hypothetical protein
MPIYIPFFPYLLIISKKEQNIYTERGGRERETDRQTYRERPERERTPDDYLAVGICIPSCKLFILCM